MAINKQETLDISENSKFGVLGFKVENNHYVVRIRWKDGKEVERIFPVKGFPIQDPESGTMLGKIDGRDALKILQEHAHEFTQDEFSWRRFPRYIK